MIPSQVNRLRICATVVFFAACNPSSNNRLAADTAMAARPDTASARPAAATTDSAIVRADLARIQGSPNAPVWVIEVSDFQCPYCREWHDKAYPAFRDEFVKTGKVRMAYVNFPLGSHVHAWPSAESAMCAGEQGKFWEMHDALFGTQARWERMPSPAAFFDSLARSTGVDIARWRSCVTSGKMKPIIQADHDRAARAGASVTPSFMIGDRILAGAQPLANLRVAIDSALAKSKKPTP